MAGKIIDASIFKNNTENILQIIADKVYEIIPYTNEELGSLLELSEDQVIELVSVINDNLIAKNKVFSSSHTNELIQSATIDANKYAEELIGKIASISLEVVDTLPTEGGLSNVIYILKNAETNINTLNVYSKGVWIEVGNLNIDLNKYYTKEEVNTLLDGKANDNTVVHQNDIANNLDNPNSTTVLSTTGLKTELDKKTEIDDSTKSATSTYSSDKIDSMINQFKTYKRGSGITQGTDISGWYTNTRVDKYGNMCNAYFNTTWKDKQGSKIIVCTLSEEIRPSESIAFNCITNNGAPAYLYMDADGVVGVTKAENNAITDGIRIPITYFSNK